MRIALTAGLVALLVLSSAVPAGTAAPARSAGPARSAPREAQPEGPGSSRAPAADLLALLDQYHEWSLQQNPTEASRRGDKRFGALLRDESPEAYAAREQFVRALRAELDAIDPTALADEDRLNADLLAYELDSFLADRPFHQEQIQLSSRSGPQIWLPQLADTLVFTTERDYADYAARLEAIGPYIDQVIAQMRLGLAAGRVPPRVTLAGVVEQTRALAAAGVARAPESSPFYEPFAAHPPDDPLAGRARAAIAGVVVPAFSRLADFLETEYVPRARESVGASEGIDGLDFYRAQLREHTTLDLSPDQVHEIGLAEVARLRAEMLETIARTDFAARESLRGDALLAAFLEYLRTDPRFYHATEADLLLGYRDIAKLIDAQLPRLFGTLPRTPYGVRAM
ncbi:MAG TPA: DUF885 domain-containing protein, partial [Phycisphaerales bacterium]|nr:DUF885 domain-containing protein [Phycisphaerales bacterium]